MERKTNRPARILRLPEVEARTGLSRSTIYRWWVAGRFPPGRKGFRTGTAGSAQRVAEAPWECPDLPGLGDRVGGGPVWAMIDAGRSLVAEHTPVEMLGANEASRLLSELINRPGTF